MSKVSDLFVDNSSPLLQTKYFNVFLAVVLLSLHTILNVSIADANSGTDIKAGDKLDPV